MSGRHRATVLLAFFVILIAGLCLALLNGLGTTITWLPALKQQTDAGTEAAAPPPMVQAGLQSYVETWSKPLFNPDRLPDPTEPQQGGDEVSGPSLDGVRLTGVVIAPGLKLALLRQADGRVLNLKEGQSLAGGWLLERIEGQKVYFRRGHDTKKLALLHGKRSEQLGVSDRPD